MLPSVGQVWKIKDNIPMVRRKQSSWSFILQADLSRYMFITNYIIDKSRGDVVHFLRLGDPSEIELEAFATEVSVKCELVSG